MNKLSFFPLTLGCILLTAGCNKHQVLDQEREKLDAERARVVAEMSDLDKKIQALPDGYNINVLERQSETLEKKAVELEAQASEKMRKWESIEARFAPLKKEAEEYKAKYGK